MPGRSDTRWVVLVRGINLGRNKRLAMADFRALLEDLGYRDVRTHLNTGNALVTTDKTTAGAVERDVVTKLEADLGLAVKVMARSARDWAALVNANPFLEEGADPKRLQAAFLSKTPPAPKLRGLVPEAYAPDRFAVGDRVLYLHMPNGFMGSKLPDWEKALGVDATIRTWNVVAKLRDLAG